MSHTCLWPGSARQLQCPGGPLEKQEQLLPCLPGGAVLGPGPTGRELSEQRDFEATAWRMAGWREEVGLLGRGAHTCGAEALPSSGAWLSRCQQLGAASELMDGSGQL